jgi:hypothetical protein
VRTFIIGVSLVLALLTTTATAAPLYLKCEGKDGPEPGPGTDYHSIKIDGATVEVDGFPAGQISNIRDHIWVFGNENEKVSGTINRITGSADLSFHEISRMIANTYRAASVPAPPDPVTFHGMCRKAGKLF